jgi:hypothetical protein
MEGGLDHPLQKFSTPNDSLSFSSDWNQFIAIKQRHRFIQTLSRFYNHEHRKGIYFDPELKNIFIWRLALCIQVGTIAQYS